MSRPLRIGISSCPNDTFAFHALLTGAVRARGLELEFRIADVEELNTLMLRGELELAKTSYAAMLRMSERILVLPCGSALGFGVGPLLLAARGKGAARLPLAEGTAVLTPGRHTTAALLLELFQDAPLRLEPVLFSTILPRLAHGEADFGVCIHEARFTWQGYGVELVADLGQVFEERTGGALPLGGLCLDRALDPAVAAELVRAVRASIAWALEHRAETLPTLRQHALESADEVLWAHVDLYVNAWTLDLGTVGRRAIGSLAALARARGLLPPGGDLRVL